ncbi:glycine-rich domain-containing protein 1 [Plakobranchus ocellatus]|uniref:Glycine-rich domain-containing protein 1 n=1 Tax=Plakobranchus ocellatus TaxID=259542 RepID=A0AAV4D8B8_9GAST|nr:glycine-rich domain-containing protein 1 [Plakobranchus ocellatus]
MDSKKPQLKQIKPSVDLVAASHNHMKFLEECDQLPALRDEGILRQALYRYQHFFLPLAASHKTKILEAPLDVAWVWHCHMLCPTSYCADCEKIDSPHARDNNSSYRNSCQIRLQISVWIGMPPQAIEFSIDSIPPFQFHKGNNFVDLEHQSG